MTRSAAVTGPEAQVLEQILQEAAGEDLTGLSQDDLHNLATRLWEWASKVPAGEQAVRVIPHAEGSKGRIGRSILEATGPDMPFLVDSLLGECAAQGFEGLAAGRAGGKVLFERRGLIRRELAGVEEDAEVLVAELRHRGPPASRAA